jgi:hypothetical protein
MNWFADRKFILYSVDNSVTCCLCNATSKFTRVSDLAKTFIWQSLLHSQVQLLATSISELRRSYTTNWLDSDWIECTMFKALVSSAVTQRKREYVTWCIFCHGYPSTSGVTHLFFKLFLGNSLLVLRFHWSIHSYQSRCLSMKVLSPGFLAARSR